jgi:hypothetical protein
MFTRATAANIVYLAAPARSDAKGRYFGVTVEDLVEGCVDCKANELG